MLRISKLTDYATVILARLAAQPEQRFTAGQLASQTHLAAPTEPRPRSSQDRCHDNRSGAVRYRSGRVRAKPVRCGKRPLSSAGRALPW